MPASEAAGITNQLIATSWQNKINRLISMTPSKRLPTMRFGAAFSDGGETDLAAELAASNDRALRLHAEMQNLRNRTSREIADERKYAALPLLRDLLPVVDTSIAAIEAAEKAGGAEKLVEGFRLVRQQIGCRAELQ